MFSYVIGLDAAVMMPVIFTALGVCIGLRFSRALKSGLLVGVGFVGLGVVTALLTSSLGPALKGMTELYHLNLPYFDLGWPAAAAVTGSCPERTVSNSRHGGPYENEDRPIGTCRTPWDEMRISPGAARLL